MKQWGNIAVAAVLLALVVLDLAVGPTDAFIATYRITGSQTLAGIANGFLRAVNWPMALVGYRPDSRGDATFLKCLKDAHLDPAAVAANPQAHETQEIACARAYDDSHIDLSNETQAQFPFRLIPSPYRADEVFVSFTNESAGTVVLGADVLFHGGGHVEERHVTAVAFPGQGVMMRTKVGLLSDPANARDFGFSAVPVIARIADPKAYGLPPVRPAD